MFKDLSTRGQIDYLAKQCCTLMTDHEREEFFKYQENRQIFENGACKGYKKMFDTGRYYHKGARKGQIKDVYNIDAILFNELWARVYAYAFKSAIKSNYSYLADAVEDIYEIKYGLFYALRFFGSSPNGVKISEFISVIVNNKLTSSSKKRGAKTLKSFDCICVSCGKVEECVQTHNSEFHRLCDNCGDIMHITKTYIPNHKCTNNNTKVNSNDLVLFSDMSNTCLDYSTDADYTVGLPEKIQYVVKRILDNSTLFDIAKDISSKKLHNFMPDLYLALINSSHVQELIEFPKDNKKYKAFYNFRKKDTIDRKVEAFEIPTQK